MNEEKVMEVFVQIRKTYNLLGEVQDLSHQMAESLDRDDPTSFQMLLSMRREPIQELAVTKERIESLLQEFPYEEAEQLRCVLNGGAGDSRLECRIAEQISANNRLWTQLSELDQRLNQKITHEKSVYARK